MFFSKCLVLSSLALVAGRFLAPPVAEEAKVKQHGVAVKNVTVIAKKEFGKNATINITKNAAARKANLSSEEQLSHLQAGLNAIQKLQSVFASGEQQQAVQDSTMASGELTSELSNKGSNVWKTIGMMLTAAQHVQGQLKGASRDQKEKIMSHLEDQLNSQAEVLKNMTDKADEANSKHSAEYVLGLLNQHRDWSNEKQLNVTKEFANSSMAVWKLAQHHDMTKPFAPQLAVIMDEMKSVAKNATLMAAQGAKKNATATPKAALTKAASAKAEPKAVEKKAAKMFIQLVASLAF